MFLVRKTYYYQPDLPTSITCWSYTGMVFLLSMIIWLEITVFQVYTAAVFVIFVIAAALQVLRRKVVVTDDAVELTTVFSMNSTRMAMKDITGLELREHGLVFESRHRRSAVLMRKNAAQELYEVLKDNDNVRV